MFAECSRNVLHFCIILGSIIAFTKTISLFFFGCSLHLFFLLSKIKKNKIREIQYQSYRTLFILFIIQILTVLVFPKTISLFFFGSLLLFNTFNYTFGKVLTREKNKKCYITLINLFIFQILTVLVFPKTISLKLFDYLLL
jgi:hypothetical protein